MPQETNVLRCYKCKMFQSHIVKKAKKWQCKICNEKQSLQRVYFQGSGKDCRLQVQQLNSLNYVAHDMETYLEQNEFVDESFEAQNPPSEVSVSHSKWNKFLDSPNKDDVNTDRDNMNLIEEHTKNASINHFDEDENALISDSERMTDEDIEEKKPNESNKSYKREYKDLSPKYDTKEKEASISTKKARSIFEDNDDIDTQLDF